MNKCINALTNTSRANSVFILMYIGKKVGDFGGGSFVCVFGGEGGFPTMVAFSPYQSFGAF